MFKILCEILLMISGYCLAVLIGIFLIYGIVWLINNPEILVNAIGGAITIVIILYALVSELQDVEQREKINQENTGNDYE